MEQVNGQTAKDISEMLLDLTGGALMEGNFDTFAICFHLPHTIETPDHKRVLETRADLKAVFDSVTDDYRRKRVTELIRICEVAEFKSETRVEATHITHLMSGNHRVSDPYPSFSVLEFIDGRWQATATQYAVDSKTTVGRAISNPARFRNTAAEDLRPAARTDKKETNT